MLVFTCLAHQLFFSNTVIIGAVGCHAAHIPSHFEIEIGATNFLYSRMSSTPEQPEQQDIDKWMGSEDGLTASRRDVMGY